MGKAHPQRHRGLKKYAGQKIEIYLQTQQIFARILTKLWMFKDSNLSFLN